MMVDFLNDIVHLEHTALESVYPKMVMVLGLLNENCSIIITIKINVQFTNTTFTVHNYNHDTFNNQLVQKQTYSILHH